MRCEVVAVGTELLLGQIVDTNSSWIGEQLALSGIDSHFQTKVGDNHARIVSALRIALHQFEWNKAARDAGVRDGALYLIRPDGYIGLADTEADVSRLRGYLARFDLQVVD